MGLVSDGGVHSHINHLKEIINVCKAEGLNKVYVHAFTDGRDCDPKSGLSFITELQGHLKIQLEKLQQLPGDIMLWIGTSVGSELNLPMMYW